MAVRCIALTKNGRCKRKGHWLCHQHKWSFPIKIILAFGFLIGVLSNFGNIRNVFFPKEKPLYLNLSAIKSNDKWLSFYPDNNGTVRDIAIWMEEHNPNDEAIELQIVSGSMQFRLNGRSQGKIGKTILPPQKPIVLGPNQKQIATAHIFVTPVPGNSKIYNTLIDGNSDILVDTNVRFRRIDSEDWYTMKIQYTINARGWFLISRNILSDRDQDPPLSTSQQPTAENIAKEVVKNLPKQPLQDESRPFFTAAAKLVFDKLNNIQSLDLAIINIGKRSANPMFGYSFIFQTNPVALIMHPQSFTNDIVVGIPRIIHEPSIKMMELKGEQYVFLYLHYTDMISKKKYSQSFYFERVIYKNGLIEYSDASSEHKKEIDSIRNANCQVIEDLVNNGADESTFRSVMEKHGLEVRNITDF